MNARKSPPVVVYNSEKQKLCRGNGKRFNYITPPDPTLPRPVWLTSDLTGFAPFDHLYVADIFILCSRAECRLLAITARRHWKCSSARNDARAHEKEMWKTHPSPVLIWLRDRMLMSWTRKRVAYMIPCWFIWGGFCFFALADGQNKPINKRPPPSPFLSEQQNPEAKKNRATNTENRY